MVADLAASFAAMYDRHLDEVYGYVYRRCQDQELAEDITQEAFLTAIRQTDDPDTITVAWLITVARNRLFDVLRRQTSYEAKLRLVANSESSVSEVDIAERLRVEAALKTLPVHYRLVLSLHYINGLPVRAIADELGQTLKSVEGLLARARRGLSEALSTDDDTDVGGWS